MRVREKTGRCFSFSFGSKCFLFSFSEKFFGGYLSLDNVELSATAPDERARLDNRRPGVWNLSTSIMRPIRLGSTGTLRFHVSGLCGVLYFNTFLFCFCFSFNSCNLLLFCVIPEVFHLFYIVSLQL